MSAYHITAIICNSAGCGARLEQLTMLSNDPPSAVAAIREVAKAEGWSHTVVGITNIDRCSKCKKNWVEFPKT